MMQVLCEVLISLPDAIPSQAIVRNVDAHQWTDLSGKRDFDVSRAVLRSFAMRSTASVAVLVGLVVGAFVSVSTKADPSTAPGEKVAAAVAARSVKGDAVAGAAIAQKWCSSCHSLGTSATASDKAPDLAVAARDPAHTPDYFRAFLVKPHPPMPPLQLTTREIDDLIAYLERLRNQPPK